MSTQRKQITAGTAGQPVVPQGTSPAKEDTCLRSTQRRFTASQQRGTQPPHIPGTKITGVVKLGQLANRAPANGDGIALSPVSIMYSTGFITTATAHTLQWLVPQPSTPSRLFRIVAEMEEQDPSETVTAPHYAYPRPPLSPPL